MRDREGIVRTLDAMILSTERLRLANDMLETTLGVVQVGEKRLVAVAPRDSAPVIREAGRDIVRFSTAVGQHEAERAAIRTFGRLVGRELLRTRTPKELKQTIRLFTRELSEGISESGSK